MGRQLDQGGAGTAVAELVLRDPGGEEPALRLQLRELISDELSYVLYTDASARAGGIPITRDRYGARPDAGEELRHAAARLDHLTSISELSPGGVERGWTADAASALHEASRVSELLAGVIPSAIGPVLDNLNRGSVVPSSPAGAKCLAGEAGYRKGTAEEIAALLGEAAVKRQDLSRQVANLQHTFGSVTGDGQKDGPALDAEVVLEWRMPGMANESRFHVRVFRPSGRLPVVVIGDMSDNHAQSITNVVGEVAAVVTEYLLGGGPLNFYQWRCSPQMAFQRLQRHGHEQPGNPSPAPRNRPSVLGEHA